MYFWNSFENLIPYSYLYSCVQLWGNTLELFHQWYLFSLFFEHQRPLNPTPITWLFQDQCQTNQTTSNRYVLFNFFCFPWFVSGLGFFVREFSLFRREPMMRLWCLIIKVYIYIFFKKFFFALFIVLIYINSCSEETSPLTKFGVFH